MKQNLYPVVIHKKLTENIYRMTVKTEEIARKARPGQFVHIRIGSGIDPLLRRPFSIHRVHQKQKSIEILYRVIGRGTGILSKMGAGQLLDIMGPLGKGFTIDHECMNAIIVAGGMGSAPAFFLMDELMSLKKSITFFWGVRSGNEIFDDTDLIKKGIQVYVSTEDGSSGEKGMVTDILKRKLEDINSGESSQGFVCGPAAMLKSVQQIAVKTGFPWQVSLEENMACGIGVCQGCAVSGNNNKINMICSDGPVFNLKEITFHD